MKRTLILLLIICLMFTACKEKKGQQAAGIPEDTSNGVDTTETHQLEEETDEQDDVSEEKLNEENKPYIEGSMEDISTQLFEAYQCKDYNKVLTEFKYDSTVKAMLTEEILVMAWNQEIAPLGDFIEISNYKKDYQVELEVVSVFCKFTNGSINFSVIFNNADEIIGFNFTPFVELSSLPSMLTEVAVDFGDSNFPIRGTLTYPSGVTSCPIVILVHGSGPLDQDETVGANKPFKDIAWQLAELGIGVLRYEKRTFAYGDDFAQNTNATVYDETIDDVKVAYDFIKGYSQIKADGIYILGHSLGGYLIPRIAELTPEADGYIMLAAPARHMEDLMVEQINYLSNLDGSITSDEQSAIDYFNQFAVTVKNLDVNRQYGVEELMNAPLSYWLDLMNYDPIGIMQNIHKPILVLQGNRDYQVTHIDYQQWMNGLSDNIDVSFIFYEGLNHLFIEGTKISTPDEYNDPGVVSEKVTNDIGNWIMNH